MARSSRLTQSPEFFRCQAQRKGVWSIHSGSCAPLPPDATVQPGPAQFCRCLSTQGDGSLRLQRGLTVMLGGYSSFTSHSWSQPVPRHKLVPRALGRTASRFCLLRDREPPCLIQGLCLGVGHSSTKQSKCQDLIKLFPGESWCYSSAINPSKGGCPR